MKSVAIFGAGVAGLTAAHELARRGYRVRVYETNPNAGGFFRSARLPTDEGMPSEYSWHGLAPWYHNVFDIMKQIPFDQQSTVYEKSLSRPIRYGIVPDAIEPAFNEQNVFGMFQRFQLSLADKMSWAYWLFKTWSSHRRSEEYYAMLNASEHWQPRMSERGWKTWRATFGPWVGSDWSRVSLHHVGQFFRRNLMSGAAHDHPADDEGPAWRHASGKGWLLMRGPSNEFWFEKWVAYLKTLGVKFFWQQTLHTFTYDGSVIAAAQLASGEEVRADVYIVAVNPFAAADIFDRTPELARLDELKLFRPLIADGPHTQVSFRIAFDERIRWPVKRAALVLADSEYNLTLFAQEQVWYPDVDLGRGIASLWTGTACVAVAPGKLYGLPLINCTKEQFLEEVKTQLLRCKGLDYLLKKANDGRGLADFSLQRIEVWHEWRFAPSGIQPEQPKWVMSNHTQPYLPQQTTPVPNLLLAGAHTRTDADIWSIEGAVESGRRAVRALEPSIAVIPQFKPLWLRLLSSIDDALFRFGLPHLVDVFLSILLVVGVLIVFQAIL